MRRIDLSGIWRVDAAGVQAEIPLPGTLDEAGIGERDDPLQQWKLEDVRRIGFWREGDPIVTRLTRRVRWEGAAVYARRIQWEKRPGERVFVTCGRSRQLRLRVNGREAPLAEPGSLSTPWRFEITDLATGDDELVFICDNTYTGWPREAIVYASAASDETQTNWNGLLGELSLCTTLPARAARVRALPRGDRLDVEVTLDSRTPWEGTLTVQSPALAETAELPVSLPAGVHTCRLPGLFLRPDATRWDLEQGVLHSLTVSGEGLEPAEIRFGIRDFEARPDGFRLNGRPVFLRGEANCAVFPLTGYPPTDPVAWREILLRYRAYGVNCMRFHSHCPPEAAFEAADALGMLMQPELSHWDPAHAFESPEARAYYAMELEAILRHLANHPSFVMLTFGNELQAGAEGHAFMDELLAQARALDPTRRYANSSNAHYGALGPDAASDFFTAMSNRDLPLRGTYDGMGGWINRAEDSLCPDYREGIAGVGKPVFCFEVGQFEVLPDFGELSLYTGVTRPDNLAHIRRRVEAAGLTEIWPRWVEATGELSLLGYRAEVEAALRTPGLSGISLLGLQDFPGQGTALVGMMNAHLRPKPCAFAQPERFRAFFRDTLPMLRLPRFTFWSGETLRAEACLAHWGRDPLRGRLRWSLSCGGEGALSETEAAPGGLVELGTLEIPLPRAEEPARLELTLHFGEHENRYPLWVYPEEAAVCPAGVYECRTLDEEARSVLARGGRVYLSPPATEEALPHSIPAQFTTDFWSVCTFPQQTGAMGQWIDAEHPLFRAFPTEEHTDWQWRTMARQRAVILPGWVKTIVAELDSYAFLRLMAQLLECRCGGGRLFFSSLGLQDLQAHPEARALQRAVYRYLDSEAFAPEQELSLDWIREMIG